jgi:hypothetical protein
VEFDDEFFILVQNYFNAIVNLQQTRKKLKELKNESTSLSNQTYVLKSITHTSPFGECGDGSKLNGTVTATVAELNKPNYTRLGEILESSRSIFYHVSIQL